MRLLRKIFSAATKSKFMPTKTTKKKEAKKMTQPKTISIDGIEYVRSDSAQVASNEAGLPYVIVRSATASPFAGYLKSQTETTVTLISARRIRYWKGAMDLNQLSTEGPSDPGKCQFGVPGVEVTIPFSEIHLCTTKAEASIKAVKEWKS